MAPASGTNEGLVYRDVRLERRTPEGRSRVVLDGISASFAPGALSLIRGPVGSGKSSLLHVLATILRPTAGEVLADGEPVSRFAPAHRDRWRRQVGLSLQASYFLDELPVLDNVMVPLVPAGPPLAEARRRALAELERLGVAGLARRLLAGLSGGERQRVTLARALVAEPRFLLVDEPTAHQDDDGAALILERLEVAREAGAVVVVVSHDGRLATAEAVEAPRWRMADGRLEREA